MHSWSLPKDSGRCGGAAEVQGGLGWVCDWEGLLMQMQVQQDAEIKSDRRQKAIAQRKGIYKLE